MDRTVVVKVGSSSLHNGEKPTILVFDSIAKQISALINDGKVVVLVSSGAIAFGRAILKSVDEETVSVKQALASIGQPFLMNEWQKAFAVYGIHIGQVLVTNQELFGIGDSSSHLKDTFRSMSELRILPVINENDAVAIEEIVQGDNDSLSAHVANLVDADSLYLLGTASALYKDFPQNTKRIKLVEAKYLNDVSSFAFGTNDPRAKGGMVSKIESANVFLKKPSRTMYVVSAKEEECINRAQICEIGTKFTS